MTPTILALLLAAGLTVPPQASQLPPWYHWLFEAFRPAGGGGSGTILTVTGISPLALVNALAAPVHSLTQFGKCVQNGTPTPSAPVDILCNNGVLRYGAIGSNLYDPSTAVFEVGYYYSPAAEGAATAAQNNFIYFSYIPIEAGAAYVFYGRRKDDNRISQYNRIHWYDAGKAYISTNAYTAGTIGKGVAPDNAVYARLSCNPQGASTAISEETVLSYNWTFCKGTAEVTPFTPFVGGVKPVGTPEVLTVGGQNLVDLTAVTDDYYYDTSGVYTALSNARLTDYIPVKSGQKYTVYVKAQRAGVAANVRCNLFDTAKTWKLQSVFSVNSGSEDVGVISPTEDGFIRVSANYGGTGAKADWSTLQIVRGEYTLSTMPPYEPYVTPQTVTDIPMLLGVGDYKDAAELIQGIKTGKVGIKVFDGTETFTVSSSGAMITAISDVAVGAQNTPMNTHFALETSPTSIAVGTQRFGASGTVIYSANYYMKHTTITTVADFKAWLASEYANGTPVIVIYPRTNEQTEQTTPYSLHSYNGTTIVDVTSPVDPVELRAEYKGVAT